MQRVLQYDYTEEHYLALFDFHDHFSQLKCSLYTNHSKKWTIMEWSGWGTFSPLVPHYIPLKDPALYTQTVNTESAIQPLQESCKIEHQSAPTLDYRGRINRAAGFYRWQWLNLAEWWPPSASCRHKETYADHHHLPKLCGRLQSR